MSERPNRCFAIIPAAGESRRMGGRDKLLLPWRGSTVIEHLLDLWTRSEVSATVIVVRPGNDRLQRLVQPIPAVEMVVPESDPPDMKASIAIGLNHLNKCHQPDRTDYWITAPADLPTLRVELINRVVLAGKGSPIVVPRFGGRRGHPVAFAWPLAAEVSRLRSDQGINALTESRPIQWIDLPPQWRPRDIDTPDQYERLLHGGRGQGD